MSYCSSQETADEQSKTSSLRQGRDAVVVEKWVWVWRNETVSIAQMILEQYGFELLWSTLYLDF